MKKLAIVVVAYNRSSCFNQALKSLNDIITTSNDIDLIISIDNKGTSDVIKIAKRFAWRHGKKIIKVHQEKLGLKRHFIWAGDQTEIYENILFIEDDLYVSPYVLEFVDAYIDKYIYDARIAGASLYNPILCEFTKCKFFQYQDGFDNFFFQHPYWGNIWSRNKWKHFKKWLLSYKCKESILPRNVRMWGDQSFKKIYIQYLIECKKYIVYPRNSYITNMGVKGLHNNFSAIQYQVVLESGSRKLRLSSLDESDSVYDAYYEITPEIIKKYNRDLSQYNFSVDLYGIKDCFDEEYVLTRKPTQHPIMTFDTIMKPQEQNIIFNLRGEGYSLTRVSDLKKNPKILNKIIQEAQCSADIMNNYPVRTKHLIFAALFSFFK